MTLWTWYFWYLTLLIPIFLKPNISDAWYFWYSIFLILDISDTRHFWYSTFLIPNFSNIQYFWYPIFLIPNFCDTWYFISDTQYFGYCSRVFETISDYLWFFCDFYSSSWRFEHFLLLLLVDFAGIWDKSQFISQFLRV